MADAAPPARLTPLTCASGRFDMVQGKRAVAPRLSEVLSRRDTRKVPSTPISLLNLGGAR